MLTSFPPSRHSKSLIFQEAGTAMSPLGSNIGFGDPFSGLTDSRIPEVGGSCTCVGGYPQQVYPHHIKRCSIRSPPVDCDEATPSWWRKPVSECRRGPLLPGASVLQLQGINCADKEAGVPGNPSKHRLLSVELRGRLEVCGPRDAATGFNDDVAWVGWVVALWNQPASVA